MKYYIECADCRDEIYEGEKAYEWEGTLICANCLEARLDDMTIDEKAELIGAWPMRIRDPRKDRL